MATKEQPTEPRPIHESEIAEHEANAEKAKAEAAAAKVNADAALLTAKANARKANAEAGVAEAQALAYQYTNEKASFELAREREKRRKELSTDEHHHTYHFDGAVDTGTFKNCMNQLNVWRRNEEPGTIELIFYSPGGSVLAGMALFDFIVNMRNEGWKFITNCRGYAASMAGILLQAGDIRICGPESYILIHEVSSGAVGKIGELEDEVEFVKLIQHRVLDIFVNRSNGKVTRAKLQAMYRRKDFWLDSTKALKLGIVDEVR